MEPQRIEGYIEESETAKSDSLVSGPTIPSLCFHALKVSLSFVPPGRHGSFRKKQTHRQRRILNSDLQISCQDLPFPDGFDLKNKSKPWIRSVDYYLKCCIEARFWKLAITGRKQWTTTLILTTPQIISNLIPFVTYSVTGIS